MREAMCWGYVRESSQKQADSGLGREGQIAAIKRLYNSSFKDSMPYGGEFVDSVVSGSVRLTERKAGAEMHKILARGDIVIISRLDRAFRRTGDAMFMVEMWNALGIKLVVADFGGQAMDLMSGIGKFVLTVLVAFAELERSYISERTKVAMAAKKARGEHIGGPGSAPYGFKYVKINATMSKLVPDMEQRELMAKFHDWYVEKGMSFDHIRQHVNYTLGIKNKWCKKKNRAEGSFGISQIYLWIQYEMKRRLAESEGDDVAHAELFADGEDPFAGKGSNVLRR